jgi:Family of unknown function (DUF6599)
MALAARAKSNVDDSAILFLMVRNLRPALLRGLLGPPGLLLALALGPLQLLAASAGEKPTIVTLIPAAAWQMISSQPADATALTRWGGDAAIEHEYGVTSFIERKYEFDNHIASALVEQAPDASSAWGLLTFYRTAAMADVAGLPLSVTGPGGALLARGRYFIRVSRPPNYPLSESDYRALLRAVGGSPPSQRVLQDLPPALPFRGMIRGSEKYLLGPVAVARVLPSFPTNLIGFDRSAEVQVAQYSTGSSTPLTLVAIAYPTPQIARLAFDTIRNGLGDGPTATTNLECRRQDTYVFVALNAATRQAAAHFLDEFKVAKTMSEDQPYPSDQPLALQLLNLLLGNAMLIMALLLFSVVGGLVVFVAKRLARKWFANSVWVEGENGGIIVLKLQYYK